MSPFTRLLIFVLWLIYPETRPLHIADAGMGVAFFLAFYLLMVLVLGLWSRRLARQAGGDDLQRKLRALNFMLRSTQFIIPLWFAAGVYLLGWGQVIYGWLDRIGVQRLDIDLPGLIIGSAPAMLAWMGLWWAQYPADRALRERNMLIQLNDDLPIHPPPDFKSYFMVNLRLQMLFILVPVLTLVLARDLLSLLVIRQIPWLQAHEESAQGIISLAAAAGIFIFAPELLRRVLHTEPLGDSPLRRRLQEICRQHHIRYKDILLWRTDYYLGNAAVMGFVPGVRYILMSDMLLEQLPDEEIEAVFAHEIGHVRHRHLLWFVAIIIIMMLALAGPGQWISDAWNALASRQRAGDSALAELAVAGAALVAGIGLFILIFGYLSRKFERQADVFAARTLQSEHDALTAGAAFAFEQPSRVGPYGASVFSSALNRVAAINNIPVDAGNWRHGSIAQRIDYLTHLGANPQATEAFDRFMFRLYTGLVMCLCLLGAWYIAAEFAGMLH